MALTPKALLDAGIASYTTLQDGDLLYTERSGAAGKTTYLQLRNDLATRTFPTWTATSADINGGTIDGTVIGGASAAAGTFTNITASFGTITSAAASAVDFITSDVANTHERTRIGRNTTGFIFQTLSSTGAVAATDYFMTVGATGATAHTFYLNNSPAMELTGSGLTVVGPGTFTGVLNFVGGNVTGGLLAQNINPAASGTYRLGAGGALPARWLGIALSTDPDVSSDARLKHDIADLTEAERRAAAKIRVRTYRLNDTGEKHVGYIAQEIIEAMKSEGLCAFEYNLVSDGETYGVHYDAVNAFRMEALAKPILREFSADFSSDFA
jgi:hypothetical protein